MSSSYLTDILAEIFEEMKTQSRPNLILKIYKTSAWKGTYNVKQNKEEKSPNRNLVESVSKPSRNSSEDL